LSTLFCEGMVGEMMKKLAIIYLCLLALGASFYTNNKGQLTEAKVERTSGGQEPVVIPDEAIRLRILANSDSPEDQILKREIRDEVNEEITEWVEQLTSIEAARTVIQQRLIDIEGIVAENLKKQGIDQSFNVKFDEVQFPTKIYGQYIYPAGNYEAILITLGEGKGANWWCVLFPPLCFLDFSNGDAVNASADQSSEKDRNSEIAQTKSSNEVEVKFIFVEIFAKLLNAIEKLL
jgi:stage II sporulation protein R